MLEFEKWSSIILFQISYWVEMLKGINVLQNLFKLFKVTSILVLKYYIYAHIIFNNFRVTLKFVTKTKGKHVTISQHFNGFLCRVVTQMLATKSLLLMMVPEEYLSISYRKLDFLQLHNVAYKHYLKLFRF